MPSKYDEHLKQRRIARGEVRRTSVSAAAEAGIFGAALAEMRRAFDADRAARARILADMRQRDTAALQAIQQREMGERADPPMTDHGPSAPVAEPMTWDEMVAAEMKRNGGDRVQAILDIRKRLRAQGKA